MPLDFPSGPAINDTWTGSNGVTYTWNGTMWVVSGSDVGPYLPLNGGTMTGPIALAADPTANPQAANKHYVDQSINLAGNYLGTWSVAANSPNISAGGSISNANYVATTVVAGTPETVPVGVPGIAGMSVANGDRVIWAAGLGVWQILRNAGVTLAAADARYYAITNPSGYQTAAQVTTALAPYALLASPPLTGDPTAPTPAYGDNDTSIATTAFVQSAVVPAANNVGRNLVHNALFNVQQRGTGGWNTNGAFTADRWVMGFVGGTLGISIGALDDTARALIGDEAAQNNMAAVVAGGSGATDEAYFEQRIENVRRTAGKTVTLSFWANPTAGTPKLGCFLYQYFGTGGSPSATVRTAGQAVTLSSGWLRYTLTFSLPSVAGKTLGTNVGTDFVGVRFGMSAGSTQSPNYGNIGVQSYTMQIWGVQLEIGTQATPLEKSAGGYGDELRVCQRFYQTGEWAIYGYNNTGQNVAYYLGLSATMRGMPTVMPTTTTSTNTSLVSITAASATRLQVLVTVAATGPAVAYGNWTASADL